VRRQVGRTAGRQTAAVAPAAQAKNAYNTVIFFPQIFFLAQILRTPGQRGRSKISLNDLRRDQAACATLPDA
jgi:hypothetical protein